MIYLVGAGPGDPELLSIKAHRLIQEASCIVYAGSLVNPEILKAADSNCALYDSASMNLKDIIRILRKYDNDPKACVVRLHTGDPSLYGAIQEQMDILKALGHQIELVPGISSFSAAAASLARELTLPEISQTLVISRNPGRTAVPNCQYPRALAALQASYCFFLSVSHASELAQELMAGGLAPDTPVACVYKASWPEEAIIHTRLDAMAEDIYRAGFKATTMIVVGRVLTAQMDKEQLQRLISEFICEDAELDVSECSNFSAQEARTSYHASKLYDEDFKHGYR